MGASSTDARQRGSESTSRGSTVYSGNGDAGGGGARGDLSVTGSTVEGINTTLAAVQKLILSSGQNTRENRETNVGGSTEVGVKIARRRLS
ncbi:hemagglutinin repeat-containing protein [Stenotrophomonas sp. HITSZ_GD]|uniref:hemagglutinin repeat-containing protein n=1 Tax=Stenotrophomonas sp. HITSZ_GD TaxID=3037248 RepID=UPI00240CE82A|nr:hemagglutinin repeat-containing protein [Stenotrophomonas sp. HITSZ_GD]MDG2524036.1 hemagglutinin repeat-containing protein [Stenotrophomonas sp. HITSZ_GD]